MAYAVSLRHLAEPVVVGRILNLSLGRKRFLVPLKFSNVLNTLSRGVASTVGIKLIIATVSYLKYKSSHIFNAPARNHVT
jgi:hypothetical protein